MDVRDVMAVVETWPVEDQLRLIEAIWDGLAEQGLEPELTTELKTELDRRLAEADARPEDAVTWESVKLFLGQRTR